ncbi:MAG: hypothetical protein LBJ89_00515 [Holosporales bacterium]|jgi:hypothetical protein|nr:hypothetical protein [Holosporales bacterium]
MHNFIKFCVSAVCCIASHANDQCCQTLLDQLHNIQQGMGDVSHNVSTLYEGELPEELVGLLNKYSYVIDINAQYSLPEINAKIFKIVQMIEAIEKQIPEE